MRPLLRRSDLTGRVYVITRYAAYPDGTIEAVAKYDVTDQFYALVREQARLSETADAADTLDQP